MGSGSYKFGCTQGKGVEFHCSLCQLSSLGNVSRALPQSLESGVPLVQPPEQN